MTCLDGVSAQALSELVGAIYDCALNPRRWPDTCRRVVALCAGPDEGTPPFRQGGRELFQVLAPHVCRALAISDLLDTRALRTEALEATLGGLALGVFLLSGDGRVVYMNAEAQRQVDAADALRLVGERIVAVDPLARAELSGAIDAGQLRSAACPLPVAIPDAHGGGYVAMVMPVPARPRDESSLLAAAVALFTQDPLQSPLMPGAAFARLHGLTSSELRVVLALSRGHGATQAADMLGISEPTMRTHLQRIYSKTRTSGQSDLLRLLDHSTPPLLREAPRTGAQGLWAPS